MPKQHKEFKTISRVKHMSEKKTLKSCVICGKSFMGYLYQTTCLTCSYTPLYPNKEAADEFVYG